MNADALDRQLSARLRERAPSPRVELLDVVMTAVDATPQRRGRPWRARDWSLSQSGSLRSALLLVALIAALMIGTAITMSIGSAPLVLPGPSATATPSPVGRVALPGFSPRMAAVGPDGNLYLSDCLADRVARLDQSGALILVAGGGSKVGVGGLAKEAILACPWGMAFDQAGNLYVAERDGNRVLRIDQNGIIATMAGNGLRGFSGDGGPATDAALDRPAFVAFDADGNLLISDGDNDRVRMVDADGIITTIAGTGENGFGGDGGRATDASFDDPAGIQPSADGTIYVADDDNGRIRRIGNDGTITTIAGWGGAGSTGDDGPATAASLALPNVLLLDPNGALYVVEEDANRVRRVDPDGTISPFAGTGGQGSTGDGGPAIEATFDGVGGLAMNADGTIYIVDVGTRCVRAVDPDGLISTFWCASPAGG